MSENPSYTDLIQRVQALESDLAKQRRFHDITQALFAISNTVNTSSDLDDVYQSIHRALGRIINVSNFSIARYTPSTGSLVFSYCIDEAGVCYPPAIEIGETESLTGEVIQSGKPILVKKTAIFEKRAQATTWIPEGPSAEIWLGVPLKIHQAIIGVMSVQSYSDPNCYDNTDLDVLATAAEQVAMAIEHKRAEQELQYSQMRMAALSEASFEALFLSDKGVCLDQNQTAERMFGHTRTEAIGRHGTEWIVPEDRDMVMQHIQTGDEDPYEATALRKDGSTFPCEIQARMIQHHGQTIRVTALRDISERKKAEAALRESEGKMRSIFRAAPIGIGLTSNRRLLEVNQRLCQITGYTKEALIGENARILYPTDDDYEFVGREKYRQIRESGTGTVETRFQCKDGRIINVLMSSTPLDPASLASGVTFTALDITENKLAENALRESERLYRQVVNTISDGLVIADEKDMILFVNTTFCDMYGYTQEELIGMNYPQLIHPDYHRIFKRQKMGIAHAGGFIGEMVAVRKDGTTFHADIRGKAIRFGGSQCLLAVNRDITERLEAEETLRRYEHIISSTDDLMSFVDSRYIYRAVNDAYLKAHGKERDEIVGLSIEQLMGPEFFHSLVKEKMDQALNGQVINFQAWIDFEGIGRRYMDVTYHPFMDDRGQIGGVVISVHDLTQRKQAENALQESEEKFRTLVEKSPLGIALIGHDGRYKYVNPQFIAIFGYTLDDIPAGKDWFEKAFPERRYRKKIVATWKADQQHIGIGEARPRSFTVFCKDGSRKVIFFRPVTMENRDQFVIYEDITEKSKLERQLQQARKFEAIGTLAGGIAHDFNNLLMGIQGRTSLLSIDLDDSHPQMEHVAAIEEYIRSATDLTKQLLGFARGGKYEVKPLDVNLLVANSAMMFGRTRKELTIKTEMHPATLIVEADRGQIEQVMLNLLVNAWQAMPDGGAIYLQTQKVVLDDADSQSYQVEPGSYVKISVTDSGIGMDETTRRRVFDPFFTTKAKSRGTGLGLASAYGIIKNHGGNITVYSELGHGTTFNIYLRISAKTIAQEHLPVKGMLTGSETILLVDDEKMIIDVGKAMLEKLGYRVVACRNGMQTADTIARMGKAIDLVILDLIMPELDGGKTFDRIRDLEPRIPVILSSGYAINGQATEIMNRGCNGFIQKPFNLTELSRKIRQVLDQGEREP